MRVCHFAVDVICIASVIGTVLKQHEPMSNYVNQFGPFWSEVLPDSACILCTALGGFADFGFSGAQHQFVHRAQTRPKFWLISRLTRKTSASKA